MPVRLLLLFTFLYSLAALKLKAQETPPEERPAGFSAQLLNVQNGLPQGYVNGIVQDKAGFIWMSTRDGLARYDGYGVKVFHYDPADSGTIASNVIQTIYSDRENNIWILYENDAVDILDPLTENITHLTPGMPLGWLAAARRQYSFYLHEDKKRRYWVVSPDLKHLQYFTRQHPDPVNIPVPEDERIIALEEAGQGEIWVCTNRTLYIIQQDHFQKISDLPRQPAYDLGHVSNMIQDDHGNWLIRNKGQIDIYQPGGKWSIVKTPYAASKTLQCFIVKSPAGHIYFNAAGHIYQLHPDHTISPVWSNPNHPYDFFAMMVDRSGVLWAGMDTFGAALINLSSEGFHSYPYQYGFVMDVLTRWLHIPFQERLRKDVNSYMPRHAYDSEGALWLTGTPFLSEVPEDKKNRLHIFGLKNGNYTPRFFDFPSMGWLQIAFDRENNCWGIIKHDTSGNVQLLVKADLTTGAITPLIEIHQPYYATSYLTAFEHNLCIVYNNSLQIYDTITGKSVVYKSKDIFGNVILLMATPDPANKGILWISTMGNGLIRFNTANGNAEAFTEKDGIPSNTVYAALADRNGYLWCSSNKGVFRFNPADSTVLSFTAGDGLQGNEFNRYHFLETADGHLFFGGTQGWTSFHPDSVYIDNFQPPSAITNILVNNTAITALPQWKDSAVNALHTLRLTHDQDFVTFAFSGLEFSNAGKIEYRYRLRGFDKDWIQIGAQHVANYTNLPPGKYLFEVNASNKTGRWSSQVKTLPVIILPPWWKTWWAYVVYGVIVLITGYLFYRYRMNRLRVRNEIVLQQKEAEHLKQVDEMKTRFFSNITHEFRTPLSLILGPLEQLTKENNAGFTPVVKKKLSGIHRNASQLLHLINQLLDMSKMEADNMGVSLSRGDLAQFIADNTGLFRQQTEQKSIQLHFDNTLHGEYLFDIDKWQKILFNLLSNAIRFTPEGGLIQVHLSAVNKYPGTDVILLSVKDTGVGIATEKLPFIFNRFYQVDDSATRAEGGTGIGLALTKELTQLMGGTIEVNSQPGKGTCFTVSLPLKKATNEKTAGIEKLKSNVYPVIQYQPEKEKKEVNTKAPSILIIEDNKELNEFIAEILRPDYRVLTAFNGKDGLQTAVEALPDIIISDIMMPEMDGYTLCEKIKQTGATNHIGFILLSARSSHDSVIRGLKHFADDYITKPFHPDELLLRVHNQTDRQQKLRDYYKSQLIQPKEKADPANHTDPFLLKIYDFIEHNIDNSQLSAEMLANEINMSHRTLNRKLEMIAGLSAYKMIRQYRLKKAAILLQSGCNVSEAAYSTGFESPSYFSVSFKACYGISPSEYVNNSLQ